MSRQVMIIADGAKSPTGMTSPATIAITVARHSMAANESSRPAGGRARAPSTSAVSDRAANVITHMTSSVVMSVTAATAGLILVTFMPCLISLAGKATQPKALCFVCSLMALLLSVDPHRAVLPWLLGMTIAAISVRERFRNI